MFCEKCGNELKENETKCSKCGNEVKKSKVTKDNKILLASAMAIIVLVIMFSLIIANKKGEFVNNTSSLEISGINASNISFANMEMDDENLTEIQKDVLNYYNDNYMSLYYDIGSGMLSKYPNVFKGTKVRIELAGVLKVLDSNDSNYELLMYEDEAGYYTRDCGYNWNEMKETIYYYDTSLFIIKGEQGDKRYIQGDCVQIYGRYQGTEMREIDGVSYNLPVIEVLKLSDYGDKWCTIDMARNIAKCVFGNDVKVTQPEPIVTWSFDHSVSFEHESPYLVTLDNQSNANFKAFDINKDYASITYNKEYNNLSDSVVKQIFIAADFNHFIVSTFDSNSNYIYFDYFDSNLNKLWSREFASTSTQEQKIPMDYTSKTMAFVVDKDLYIIDLETGKNLIDPVIVGKKTGTLMLDDGIILIGDENKDTIMKVSYEGKIIFRKDGETEIKNINSTWVQIIDNKLLLYVEGMRELISDEEIDDMLEKYYLIDKDGNIEFKTDDMSSYMG